MQMRFPRKSSKVHATAPQTATIEYPTGDLNASSLSAPERPNLALAGILIGCPVMISGFVALLFAGRPILEALLVACGLQILAFCAVIVVGLASAKLPERTEPMSRLAETSDIW